MLIKIEIKMEGCFFEQLGWVELFPKTDKRGLE